MDNKEILDTAKFISKTLPAIPKVVNDFIELSIGNWIEYRNSLSKEKFKIKLKEKLGQISKDKIIEPKLSILGPALEASKYYIEEEEIQELFSNLIASSMNEDTAKYVHHSFVEVIKQLSPLDAKILKELDKKNPIVDIYYEYNFKKSDFMKFYLGNEAFLVLENLFFNEIIPESKLNSISLDNLIRHGLIKINKDITLSEKGAYSQFENSKVVLKLKEKIKNKVSPFDKEDGRVAIKHHVLFLTSYGETFKKVCIK